MGSHSFGPAEHRADLLNTHPPNTNLGPTGVRENLLGVAEVARRLGVCTATIYSLLARGDLPHIRIMNAIRVCPADLETFIKGKRR